MITKDKVVSMHYTLKDDEGNVIDASEGEPLEFLHGHANIIPGLEKALSGLAVGDKKHVEVQPEEGYGAYDAELVDRIGRDQFKGNLPPVGSTVELHSDQGDVLIGRISEVTEQHVVFDANHPLAGKRLHFDVEIADVRDASPDEIEHGHPHGAHGHHHHDHEEGDSCGEGGCGACGDGGCGDEACDCSHPH